MAEPFEEETGELGELVIRRARSAAGAVLQSGELPMREFAAPGADEDVWERLCEVRSLRTALAALRDALDAVDGTAAAQERALETQDAVTRMCWSIVRSFHALDDRLAGLTTPTQRANEIARTVRAALDSSRFQQFAARLEAVVGRGHDHSEWTQATHLRAAEAYDALARLRRDLGTDGVPSDDREADWLAFRDSSTVVLEEAVSTAGKLATQSLDGWRRAVVQLDEALAIITHLRRAG